MDNPYLHAEQAQVIVQIARSWIGTPYKHQAAVRGVGCDCLGLVRGIYKEFYGELPIRPEDIPPYSNAWGEATNDEIMLNAASEYLEYRGGKSVLLMLGDVLVLRMRRRSIAKHAVVYVGNDRIVHSMEGCVVSEVNLIPSWKKKIAGVFCFKPR